MSVIHCWAFIFIIFVIINSGYTVHNTFEEFIVDCNMLRMGQYMCPDPQYSYIDPKTQQLKGCRKDNKAKGM